MNKSKIIKNGTVNLLKLQLKQQDKRELTNYEVIDTRVKKDMIDCELPGNAVTISPSDDVTTLALRVPTILTLRWVLGKIRMPFNPRILLTDGDDPFNPFPLLRGEYRTPIIFI
jgi:hypothetical protein